jgi:hypothetical protein
VITKVAKLTQTGLKYSLGVLDIGYFGASAMAIFSINDGELKILLLIYQNL